MDVAKFDGDGSMNVKAMNLIHTYSDTIYNKKVAVLGPYPPPLGGISVHIQRVINKFKTQNNKTYLFNTTKRNWLFWYVFKLIWFCCYNKPQLVYYHTVDLNSRLHEFRLLMVLKKILKFQLIVIEHNCRYLDTKPQKFKNEFSKLIAQCDQLILIGASTHVSYERNQISLPRMWSVESAFLPPDVSQEHTIRTTYPPQIIEFIAASKPLIIITAFDFSFLNGKDLYGIDITLEAFKLIKKQAVGARTIIGMASNTNPAYFSYLGQKIKEYEIDDSVFFLIGNYQLWPLIKQADLFLRPTLSDGQSVSICEALYFKVPTIASNAVPRQNDVILFKSGDSNDLYQKMVVVLIRGHNEQLNKQRHFMHAQ